MYKSYFRMTFAISDIIIILLYVNGYIKNNCGYFRKFNLYPHAVTLFFEKPAQ